MEYKYITFEDVMRFLDQKAIIKACPSCATQAWTLQYSRLSDNPSLIFATNLLGIGAPFQAGGPNVAEMLPFGRPVLPLICNNCGYMKIHDYEIVKKWVEANPQVAEQSQEVTPNDRPAPSP